MAKKADKLVPKTSLQTQAVQRMELNKQNMNPRQFRDAVTKVTGGVRGVPTSSTQWNRWTP